MLTNNFVLNNVNTRADQQLVMKFTLEREDCSSYKLTQVVDLKVILVPVNSFLLWVTDDASIVDKNVYFFFFCKHKPSPSIVEVVTNDVGESEVPGVKTAQRRFHTVPISPFAEFWHEFKSAEGQFPHGRSLCGSSLWTILTTGEF